MDRPNLTFIRTVWVNILKMVSWKFSLASARLRGVWGSSMLIHTSWWYGVSIITIFLVITHKARGSCEKYEYILNLCTAYCDSFIEGVPLKRRLKTLWVIVPTFRSKVLLDHGCLNWIRRYWSTLLSRLRTANTGSGSMGNIARLRNRNFRFFSTCWDLFKNMISFDLSRSSHWP